MPTYEYECLKCKKRFEVFQQMKDKPLAKCKFCGGKVERLISAGAGLIFKGSGFYATDYRRKNDSHKLKESAPPTCPAENPSCHNCPKAKDGK